MADRNWPHPVLESGTGDYPNCSFQASLVPQPTTRAYRIEARFDLGSETLEQAIGNGLASYAVRVHCPMSAYRALHRIEGGGGTIEIPEAKLHEEVQLRPYIISDTSWFLASKEFAEDFEGLRFPIRKGHVLAIGPETVFDADKHPDALRRLHSIFTVRSSENDKEVTYDLSGEKIVISLPKSDFEPYRNLSVRNLNDIFAAALIVPALTIALTDLKQGSDGDEGRRWERAIRARLAEKRIDLSEKDHHVLPIIAQQLLKAPFSRAVSRLASFMGDLNL